MKNILIISRHPDLQHFPVNAEILAKVKKFLLQVKSANWACCIRTAV